MTDKKYVYFFSEGNKSMKELLGGKGANLAEMTNLGIPVPPGFTITAEACADFSKNDNWPEGMAEQIELNLKQLEEKLGKKFGDESDPLLLSVRSGAAISMPGMMDTVLNLGMNDKTVVAIATKTNNERFAWDSYRRFIQMFGDVDMGVEHKLFENALESIKKEKGVEIDTDLGAEDLKRVVEKFKEVIKKHTGTEFPQDPKEQLKLSINSVFKSWNNNRAVAYRELNHITGLLGTAVNVQTMVFGNMGETSGTGVCFTRDPATGENKFYGEFLMNAQGEDVVAGIRTPLEISKLSEIMPEQYKELVAIYKRLEQHYKEMQDMEFTIQEGNLFILQTRTGKRTAQSAVKIAVDMYNENLIDKKTAVLRVDPDQLDKLLHKQLDPKAKETAKLLAKGLPASPGAVVGTVVFTADQAVAAAENKEKVILVRTETSPEDIKGMNAAQGILTARGGMTSHAAVVARGMGKCCVAGCGAITVHEEENKLIIGDKEFGKGDFITLDGATGEVFDGQLGVIDPDISGDFATLMAWADEFRTLKVRANADTPHDSQVARDFGAQGIGLCRTEHMFFDAERIMAVREMILAEDAKGRREALHKILPMQRSDFAGLFEVMKGLPVTIRLLDPPLHEFLPNEDKEINELAADMNIPVVKLKDKIKELHELNPMLGLRGCRLGITFPVITEMQARAIFEAAVQVTKKGIEIHPEVMVPLVGKGAELRLQKEIIVNTAKKVMEETDTKISYTVGTMIEVPRAAVTADKIAESADFFSFGTNDLTQMGAGLSRDDAGKFLPIYVEKGIYARDPFQALDQEGIGELMKIAIKKGRSVKPDLKMGICGEHGGEPSSIDFCHRVGLNYISCSPFRVPIARLAAAHAAIKNKQ